MHRLTGCGAESLGGGAALASNSYEAPLGLRLKLGTTHRQTTPPILFHASASRLHRPALILTHAYPSPLIAYHLSPRVFPISTPFSQYLRPLNEKKIVRIFREDFQADQDDAFRTEHSTDFPDDGEKIPSPRLSEKLEVAE